MVKKLHILMLEDNPDDAELVKYELNKIDMKFEYTVVDSHDSFLDAITHNPPDLILSDYSLPGFNGLKALSLAAEKCPQIPYIFVSGHIGEDRAINALKMGATDYVLKDRITKLVPTVERAIKASEERKKRKMAEEALIASEARYRTIYETSILGIITADSEGNILKLNKAMESILGYTEEEIAGKSILEITYPEDREISGNFLDNLMKGKINNFKSSKRYITKNKNLVWVNIYASSVKDENGDFLYSVGIVENITAKKIAEDKLKESEEKLHTIIDNLNIVFYTTNLNGIFNFSRGKGLESVGLKSGEVVGKSIFEVFSTTKLYDTKNRITTVYEVFNNVINGKAESVVTQVGEIYYDNKLFPCYNNRNEIIGVVGLAIDITREKTNEIERIQLARFPNDNPNPVFKILGNGQILFANKASTQLLQIWDVEIGGYLKGNWLNTIIEILLEGKVKSFESKENGHHYLFTITPITEYNYVNVYGFEITGRKNAEEALRLSERKYKDIFELALHGIFQTDSDGKFLTVNPAFVNMLNYPSETELLEKKGKDLYWDKNIADEVQEIMTSEGQLRDYEIRLKKWDNNPVWVQINSHEVKDNAGNVLYYEGFVVDINERKKAEQALKESEKRFKELAELLPQTIFEINKEYRITYLNKSGLETLAFSEAELPEGLSIKDFAGDDQLEKLLKAFHLTISGIKLGGFEFLAKKNNGKTFPCTVYANPVIENGESTGIRGILIDDTERKKIIEEIIEAKEKAEESDKLKSEFLAQMSHEIRTPLNVILSYNSFIQDELIETLPKEWSQIFNSIDSASKRLMRTIDLILNMSMIQTGHIEVQKEQTDLVYILKNTVYSFRSIAENKNIVLTLDSEYDSLIFISDEYILGKIFENLVDNAIKFSFEGTVKIKIYINPDKKMCVDIADTGVGMTEEYLKKVFTPFLQEERGYSRRFEGNGLGLALVRKYIELFKAEINIDSKKNKGSVIKIIFNDDFIIPEVPEQ